MCLCLYTTMGMAAGEVDVVLCTSLKVHHFKGTLQACKLDKEHDL